MSAEPRGSASYPPAVRASGVTGWLRQLDRDASTGALWRRPLFFVVAYSTLGIAVGAIFGVVLSLTLALALPGRSEVPGPEGSPITVVNDYTALPFLGALSGATLGLAAGGALAFRRWRRTR